MLNSPLFKKHGIGLTLSTLFFLSSACIGPIPGRIPTRPTEPSSRAPMTRVKTPESKPGAVPIAPVAVRESDPSPAVESTPGPVSEILPPVMGLDPWPVAVLWAPAESGDSLSTANYLKERPWMRVTVVFPSGYFTDTPRSLEALAVFQSLVASRQLEIVLTLPGDPVVPLIMDTNNALLSSQPLGESPPPFSWPSDISEQLELARSSYRKIWRATPSGVQIPWGVIAGPERSLLASGRMEWALLSSSSTGAFHPGPPLPMIQPTMCPTTPEEQRKWIESLLEKDTGGFLTVPSVRDADALQAWTGNRARWVLFSEYLTEKIPSVLGEAPLPPTDFSPWIGGPEKNRAWELLAIARSAIDDYQNSGQADLKTLDLAKREMFNAENGKFVRGFGSDETFVPELEREFLATLTQIYQIMDVSLPADFISGFSSNSVATDDGPKRFFEQEGNTLRWRDDVDDDRGPGDFFYPTGAQYETGSWDIRTFDVRPNDDEFTLAFDFSSRPNPWRAPGGGSFPLVDLYIDINHSPGAGSMDLLPGRPGQTSVADAWEYALTLDGWGAKLYQYHPGQPPSVMARFPVEPDGETGFRVTLPRTALRGDPGSWGFAVAVMGRTHPSGDPMPVSVNPGLQNFGGAAEGTSAPPYIDLIVPPGVSQRSVLGNKKTGPDILLPFIRAEGGSYGN